MNIQQDFEYHNGGCYLSNSGRPKFLKFFLQRMEEEIQAESGNKQPRWDILTQQVKAFKTFIYNPIQSYKPYQIR